MRITITDADSTVETIINVDHYSESEPASREWVVAVYDFDSVMDVDKMAGASLLVDIKDALRAIAQRAEDAQTRAAVNTVAKRLAAND